jgi:RNA polymerase-binding transcription factor DksA
MSDPNDAYAARLASERTATAERLESLRRQFGAVVAATEGSNADDEHDPEGSTIAYERSQLAALVEQAEQHLTEIAAAEERLADGTYGRCSRCGRDIPAGRLEARPVARTCVECAAR